jgi:ankyrin repeat protein
MDTHGDYSDDDTLDYEGLMCDLRSTQLHDTVRAKDLNTVRRLLSNGADVKVRNGQARDVLQPAVTIRGNEEIIRLLLNSGANSNNLEVHETASEEAAKVKESNILQMLLDSDAKINTPNPLRPEGPL